ncbi:MAG TPA: DNA-binding protein, partial [Sulfurihydrogenibium azorense]|nr:DNA-binding protein [Sulfurihydrogenibium azorense]
MNKSQLVSAVAEKAGIKKVVAEKAVNAAIEAVAEAIAKGE